MIETTTPDTRELRVRDMKCPEWVDEWLWNRILAELGDQPIAKIRGFSIGVCSCCGSVHSVPVMEHEEVILRLVFERLGVAAGPCLAAEGR